MGCHLHWNLVNVSLGFDNALVTTQGTFQVGNASLGTALTCGNRDERPQSKVDLHATEVTDILPFNEFGSLDDLDFHAGAFDSAAEILRAPELDDVVDTDEMPLTLMRRMDLNVIHDPDATDIIPRVSGGGLHRKPAASALKGRVMIAAMAAGAAAAAAHTAINPSDEASATAVLSSDVTVPSANAGETPRGMQVVSVTPAAHSSVHSEELAKGVAYAQERAEREARLAAPCSSSRPTGSSPRASVTAGVPCTPASTSPAPSAPRSTR